MNEKEWNQAYQNKNNFVFYPNEEIIRFVNKYIARRVGIDTYEFKSGFNEQSNYLDLGCGIGRHLMYGLDVGFNVTGIDLSEVAVQTAKRYISTHPKVKGNEQVIATSATAMPFKNEA